MQWLLLITKSRSRNIFEVVHTFLRLKTIAEGAEMKFSRKKNFELSKISKKISRFLRFPRPHRLQIHQKNGNRFVRTKVIELNSILAIFFYGNLLTNFLNTYRRDSWLGALDAFLITDHFEGFAALLRLFLQHF